ncbi:MAG: hypothetical protein N2376_07540 [Clostridia bacterium]|nr:hypothetical protein [Clostridia bacterium]
MGYIEDTREPEDNPPVASCLECEEPLYSGDEVADVPAGYICINCKTSTALKHASKDELKDFITSNNLEDKFGIWFYEPYVKILED